MPRVGLLNLSPSILAVITPPTFGLHFDPRGGLDFDLFDVPIENKGGGVSLPRQGFEVTEVVNRNVNLSLHPASEPQV